MVTDDFTRSIKSMKELRKSKISNFTINVDNKNIPSRRKNFCRHSKAGVGKNGI